MTGQNEAMTHFDVPGPSFSPWQRLYGFLHRLRRRWWKSRARRLPRPVVSVGNLHWGGGGKTPLTAAIARHLVERGVRVAILSRGYGRKKGGATVNESGVVVVSHGNGPLLGPTQAGDEPVLLAAEVPGAAVVVCGDRHRAGVHALERLDPPPDVFLLDDGFSHLALGRDVDLLVFPGADPVGGGRLKPGGDLREPLEASSRADALLFASPEAEPEDGRRLARALGRHGFAGEGFVSRTVAEPPRPVGSLASPASASSSALAGEVGGPVLAVSAIARHSSFVDTLRRLGLEIARDLAFRDHHRYPAASLEKIRNAFHDSGAVAVAVTSKDRVKLQGRLELPLVEIPLRAEPEPAFFEWLDERLHELGVSYDAPTDTSADPGG